MVIQRAETNEGITMVGKVPGCSKENTSFRLTTAAVANGAV